MTLDKLEFYLARGNAFGTNVEVTAKGCLAVVRLTKRKVSEMVFEVFDEVEHPLFFHAPVHTRNSPYQVTIAELPRPFYDHDVSPSSQDYRVNKSFLFRSLEEVQLFLVGMNIDILTLEWSSEIEFN